MTLNGFVVCAVEASAVNNYFSLTGDQTHANPDTVFNIRTGTLIGIRTLSLVCKGIFTNFGLWD